MLVHLSGWTCFWWCCLDQILSVHIITGSWTPWHPPGPESKEHSNRRHLTVAVTKPMTTCRSSSQCSAKKRVKPQQVLYGSFGIFISLVSVGGSKELTTRKPNTWNTKACASLSASQVTGKKVMSRKLFLSISDARGRCDTQVWR